MKRLAIAIAVVGVAVLVGLFVHAWAEPASPETSPTDGTRSPATYVGVDVCKGCHSTTHQDWSLTNHGQDFTQYPYRGGVVNKLTMSGGRCLSCHVVGYDETANGGYDSGEAWNSSHNIKLLGIQCESCHGPGSDHVGTQDPAAIAGRPTPEASCYGTDEMGCHGPPPGHFNYWNQSGHAVSLQAAGGSVATNPGCQKCHTREGFINFLDGVTGTVTDPNSIDCAACHDPHEATNHVQLRVPEEELCGLCHNNGLGPAEPGPDPHLHHPQAEMNAGYGGANLTMPAGMAGVSCVDCHMWQTPEVSHGLPVTDIIGGEEHWNHWFEPSADGCAGCHAPNILALMPGEDKPTTQPDPSDETNYTLWEEWETFEPLWEGEVHKWELVIESWQAQTGARWAEVDALVEAAHDDLLVHNASADADPEKLAKAWALYYDARWNLDYIAADGSGGVHNFDYAMGLLTAAEDDAREIPSLLVPLAPDEPEPAGLDTSLLYAIIGLLVAVIIVLLVLVGLLRSRMPPAPERPPEED